MKLSEIIANGDVGAKEFYGVELDTFGVDDLSFIKRISFKADLKHGGFVDPDFLYKLSIWNSNAYTWKIETFVEVPCETESDIESILYGISAMDASVFVMPPKSGASAQDVENYINMLRDVGEMAFTRSFQSPVQPISGCLSGFMAQAYKGEFAQMDKYVESSLDGTRGFENCLSDVNNVVKDLIASHIGDAGDFEKFSKELIDGVAIKVKTLLVDDMVVVD